jgi:hypothetical protein
MKRYIVPKKNRRYLVVEESVHDVVSLYATLRGISIVEATFQLLKLGLSQAIGAQIPKSEINNYCIAEPLAEKLCRWFHNAK